MPEYRPCRQCGKPLLWARTNSGNLLALDADPVEGGTVSIVAGAAHVFNGTLFEPLLEGPKHRIHECEGAPTCS